MKSGNETDVGHSISVTEPIHLSGIHLVAKDKSVLSVEKQEYF